MNNIMIVTKGQWLKKLVIAASLMSIPVLANPGISSAEAVSQQVGKEEALQQMHAKVDKYVFETNSDELALKGIHVTNTGPVGDVIEIGILDYTEEKADYLYNAFGKELVKVVEGEQATTLVAGSTDTAIATTSDEENKNDQMQQKHSEIDEYVFETHTEELAEKGIQVTSTGPVGDFIEIGIVDYTDEKAEHLYNLFGKELVKVVEGAQAVTMDTPQMVTTASNSGTLVETEASNGMNAAWIAAIAVVLLGAILLFARKLRVFKN